MAHSSQALQGIVMVPDAVFKYMMIVRITVTHNLESPTVLIMRIITFNCACHDGERTDIHLINQCFLGKTTVMHP